MQEKYEAFFIGLGPDLQAAVQNHGNLVDVKIMGDIAELAIIRTEDSQKKLFYVYMLYDHGKWMISEM